MRLAPSAAAPIRTIVHPALILLSSALEPRRTETACCPLSPALGPWPRWLVVAYFSSNPHPASWFLTFVSSVEVISSFVSSALEPRRMESACRSLSPALSPWPWLVVAYFLFNPHLRVVVPCHHRFLLQVINAHCFCRHPLLPLPRIEECPHQRAADASIHCVNVEAIRRR